MLLGITWGRSYGIKDCKQFLLRALRIARVTLWCFWGPCTFLVLEIEMVLTSSARCIILAGFPLIILHDAKEQLSHCHVQVRAVQSTNQWNRQQLAFRKWLPVHSTGSCGDYVQPDLPRTHWEGSVLGHFIALNSQAFLCKPCKCCF